MMKKKHLRDCDFYFICYSDEKSSENYALQTLHYFYIVMIWLYIDCIQIKSNFGIKVITTCANQTQFPGTARSKKFFQLGDN